MYSNILVTLDGSNLAEAALAHIKTIYNGCREKPKVTVLMVMKPVEKPYGTTTAAVSSEVIAQFEQMESEAVENGQRYLDNICSTLRDTGIAADEKLVVGKPAETIIDFIEKNNCDLLVMSSHGRSGIGRWVMGSVADKVLRNVCIPVMLVRAPKCGTLFPKEK